MIVNVVVFFPPKKSERKSGTVLEQERAREKEVGQEREQGVIER